VVGPVSSLGAPLAAENAMYRAVQKEAAELGANAIIIGGPGIGPNYNGFRRGKALQALRNKVGNRKSRTWTSRFLPDIDSFYDP
jgi:hypothetical protein